MCLSVYNPSPRGIRNHFAKLTPSETLCTRKEKAPGWGSQGQLQPLPLIPSVSLWAQSQSSQRGRASSVPGIKDSHLEACHPPGPPVQQPPWPLKPQPLTRVILSKEPTNQPVDQWARPRKPFSLRPSPPTQQGPRPGPPKGSALVDACRAQLRSTAIVGDAVVSRGGGGRR